MKIIPDFLLVLLLLYSCSILYKYASSFLKRDPDPSWYYVAYPGDYKFILNNAAICRRVSPFLVLMVPVAPGNRIARDTIRNTWGQEQQVWGRRVITLFFLGLPSGHNQAAQQQKVVQENQLYRDLIQIDFLDSHHNLTIKTMMMLEWLDVNCVGASYVMKVDSDVYLSVRNLVDLLVKPGTANKDYMSGLVWWRSEVLRDELEKFYVPETVIPRSILFYDPYPLGMAYVMSSDLPKKILSVAHQVKAFLFEDVYLGMCLKKLGLKPTRAPEETMFIVKPSHPLDSCSLAKVIAMTTESVEQMETYWWRSRKPVKTC